VRKLHPPVASQRPCPLPGSLRFSWGQGAIHKTVYQRTYLMRGQLIVCPTTIREGVHPYLAFQSQSVVQGGKETLLLLHAEPSWTCISANWMSVILIPLCSCGCAKEDRSDTWRLPNACQRVLHQALMNLYQPSMSWFVRNSDTILVGCLRPTPMLT